MVWTGSNRVNRGGGWGYDAINERASNRNNNTPDNRNNNLGFRLAAPAHRVADASRWTGSYPALKKSEKSSIPRSVLNCPDGYVEALRGFFCLRMSGDIQLGRVRILHNFQPLFNLTT